VQERDVPVYRRRREDAALGEQRLFRQSLPLHRAHRDILVSPVASRQSPVINRSSLDARALFLLLFQSRFLRPTL